MDFSSSNKNTGTPGSLDPFQVKMPFGLLCPWLRLAHFGTLPPSQRQEKTFLRKIDDFELILLLEGSTWIWSGPHQGSVEVQKGDVVFIPPGLVHAWCHRPQTHIAVHFDLHAQPCLQAMDHIHAFNRLVEPCPLKEVPLFQLCFQGEKKSGKASFTTKKLPRSHWVEKPPVPLPAPQGSTYRLVTRVKDPWLWRSYLEKLVYLWQRQITTSLAAQLIIAETVGWALQQLALKTALKTGDDKEKLDARISRFLDNLENPSSAFYRSRPSVRKLARSAGMSETSFRMACRQMWGTSPRTFFERQRIERAARALIETGLTIQEVASSEGYDDPYHFSRVFKRVTGMPPRRYRQSRRHPEGVSGK